MFGSSAAVQVRIVTVDLDPADYHAADADRLRGIAAMCVEFGAYTRPVTDQELANYPAAEKARYEQPQTTVMRNDALHYYTVCTLYGPHVDLTELRVSALIRKEPLHVDPAHIHYDMDLSDPALPMKTLSVRVHFHDHPLNVTTTHLLSFATYTVPHLQVAGSEQGNGTVVRRNNVPASVTSSGGWASNANSPRVKRPRLGDE